MCVKVFVYGLCAYGTVETDGHSGATDDGEPTRFEFRIWMSMSYGRYPMDSIDTIVSTTTAAAVAAHTTGHLATIAAGRGWSVFCTDDTDDTEYSTDGVRTGAVDYCSGCSDECAGCIDHLECVGIVFLTYASWARFWTIAQRE